jgi:hypothetical protein
MATSVDLAIVGLLAARPEVRDVAGAVLVVVLVALLVEREVLRHRSDAPGRLRSVTAMTLGVGFAWLVVVGHRLVALL